MVRDWPPVGQYPWARLSNGRTDALIMMPDKNKGYYRGPRFDWAGMVVRVRYAGHTFFGPLNDPHKHQPTKPNGVAGTAEAYGLNHPPGYEQAKSGESFIKIGVGLLKKTEGKPYSPTRRYPIVKAGLWKVERGPDSRYLTFKQTLDGPNALAYDYTKTVTLDAEKPVLTITRTLKNTGDKPIHTTHLSQPVIAIDQTPIGPAYRLDFAFNAKPTKYWKANPLACIKHGDLAFTKPLKNQSVQAPIAGWSDQASDNSITVHNRQTDAAVAMETNQPLSQLSLHANATSLRPVSIIDLDIGPGQTKTWRTTYTFATSKR